MPPAHPDASTDRVTLPPLPGWITAASAQTLDAAAFRSGAALAYLSLAAGQALVPQALWRNRLALAAVEVCAGLSGRREGGRALRNAVHLLRPGDHPGPAGLIFQHGCGPWHDRSRLRIWARRWRGFWRTRLRFVLIWQARPPWTGRQRCWPTPHGQRQLP